MVLEFIADRISYNEVGVDWALIVLCRTDLGLTPVCIVSAHLPLQPNTKTGPDFEEQQYLSTLDAITEGIHKGSSVFPGLVVFESHDANVEISL